MLKACSYCGRIHKADEICPKKPKKAKRSYENTAERKFRSSGIWRKKAIEIKERDNYCCQICFEKKIINYNNLEVHHITKLCDDERKALDNNNLITLCVSCHKLADSGIIKKKELTEILKKRGLIDE